MKKLLQKKSVKITLIIILVLAAIYTFLYVRAINERTALIHSDDVQIMCADEHQSPYAIIHVTKGKRYAGLSTGIFKFVVTPQMAIWTEDMDGNYLETLYVTKKVATINRQSALPIYMDTLSKEGLSVDSVSSASASINTTTIRQEVDNRQTQQFKVYMEINNSFDYNATYKQNLPKEDPGYNTGYCGQPAVVYLAHVNLGDKTHYTLEPIGHSDPTGESPELFQELESIQEALQIVDKVEIVFE